MELYEAGELTGAINRIIEDMNHRFVLSVLTKDFKSGDLGNTAKNLRKERDPQKRTSILYEVNREARGRMLEEIILLETSKALGRNFDVFKLMFGSLAGRFVLYLGENLDTEDGIAYRNAGQFLKGLPEINLYSGLEEPLSGDAGAGWLIFPFL